MNGPGRHQVVRLPGHPRVDGVPPSIDMPDEGFVLRVTVQEEDLRARFEEISQKKTSLEKRS